MNKEENINSFLEEKIKNIENEVKKKHSKNAIFQFIIFAILLFIFNDINIFNIGAILFLFIGIFLSSFLSIPTYMIKLKISEKITLEQTLKLKRFYWIFEGVYNFFITYILFHLYQII